MNDVSGADGVSCSPRPTPWPRWFVAAAIAATVASTALSAISVVGGVGVATLTLGGMASVSDVRWRRLPNVVSLAVALTATLIALGTGRVALVATAALCVGATLLIVHLAMPSGLGFGDVKYGAGLAALTANALPLSGVTIVVVIASLLASLAPAAITAWRRGVPYGAVLTMTTLIALVAEVRP